jgi:predicted nucleic acid-binding Zn ribbon protein
MNVIIIIFLVTTLILVLATLAGGLITMARGGELGPKKSNLFMRYRVLFQGIAVLLVVIFLSLAKD